MSPRPHSQLGDGCIAVLRGSEGLSARHFPADDPLDAVRDVAAYCDATGSTVVVISTPRTIYTDLRGRGKRTARPETSMLRHIGRTDLAER
jgi:hypothetical protein